MFIEFMQKHIIRQIGHCIGGNFNIHIWAWSASLSAQVGRLENSRTQPGPLSHIYR